MCGHTNREAYLYLAFLERATAPDAMDPDSV
jgi:hypothetical protein